MQRRFLARAVRYLAAEAGITQFLDIGTGLPTANNTHQIAQQIAPHSRIVYVDNDPLVLVHAEALLTSVPGGVTSYIEADVRDPDTILRGAARTLDLSRPVALMLLGIMGQIDDSDEPGSIVTWLLDALPPGSYLALFDGTDTNPELNQAIAAYNQNSASSYHLRSPNRIAGFFAGLDPARVGDEAVRREQRLGDALAAGHGCGRGHGRGPGCRRDCDRGRRRGAGPVGRDVGRARREQRHRRGDERGGQPLGRQPPATQCLIGTGPIGTGLVVGGTRNSPHAWVSFWSCSKGSGARAITHISDVRTVTSAPWFSGPARTLSSASMPRLLVVHHTPSPALQEMFEAAVSGARTDEIDDVEVIIRPALTAAAVDVLEADGILLGTPVAVVLGTRHLPVQSLLPPG